MDAEKPQPDPTPAIDFKLNAEQLSSEEFHRRLYGWFEDRGLLSDLRSHLRTKMIHVLKETPIGRSDIKKSMSPKVQAVNLLLAEFLIQQNCFYTLSVLSTEVPLVNILPELNNNFMNKPDAGWRFEEKDALDILETLGFGKDGEAIAKTYFDADNKEALLLCILKTPSKEKKQEMDIAAILKASPLPMLTVEQILQKLNQNEQETNYLAKFEEVEQQKQYYKRKNETYQRRLEELSQKEQDLQKKAKELEEEKLKCEMLRVEYESIMAKNESEVALLRQTIEQLREENVRLENANGVQRRRAEKLQLNARLLNSELSAARYKRKSYVAGARPKTASYSGEGEQAAVDLSTPLLLPQPHHLMGRKQHHSSSDETHNVLEQTRERLHRLQQENDRIDRKISFSFNQQKKYLQATSSSSDSEAASSSKNFFSSITLGLLDEKDSLSEPPNLNNVTLNSDLEVGESGVSSTDDKKLEVFSIKNINQWNAVSYND